MTRSPRRLKQQVQDTVGEQVRDLPLHAVRLAMFGVGRALLLSDRVTRDYKELTEGGGVKPVIGRLRADVTGTAGKVTGTAGSIVGHVVGRVRGGDAEPEPEPASRARATARRTTEDEGAGAEISIGKPAAKPASANTAAGEPAAKHTPRHARPDSGPVAKPAPNPAVDEPKPEAEAQAKPAPSPEPVPSPEPAPKLAAEAAPDGAPEAGSEPDPEKAAFEPRPELKPAAQAEAERAAKDLPVPNYDAATLPQLRARLRGLSADQVKLLREYERKHLARAEVLRMYENRISKLNGLS
ncbi:hypothetical protein [Actinomadura fibrosa]|uniref:DUF8129 domain-containing protein n=1 Tax=Actinomadura fibrosa TaxID=111802 RepID=A0ABW2XHW1_9ACTN|nr:hypothetical protein [Actinomadura fibrosa]